MDRKLRQDAELRAKAKSQQNKCASDGISATEYYPQISSSQTLRIPQDTDDNRRSNCESNQSQNSLPTHIMQYQQNSLPTHIMQYQQYTSPLSSQKCPTSYISTDTSTTPDNVHCERYPTTPQQASIQNETDVAAKARDEWQKYGTIKTQILEDIRHGRHQPNIRNWKIAKVVSAEQRTDISGANYTVYMIHLWDRSPSPTPTQYSHDPNQHENTSSTPSSMQIIERRYSDFCKLYNSICQGATKPRKHHSQKDDVTLSAEDWFDVIAYKFPHKHWAGRIGNWTPAKYLAPQQYHDVIDERIHLFDAWLVYVVYAYNMYPVQTMQQQNSVGTVFFSEYQNSIVHDYISNPLSPPPYMTKPQLNNACSTGTIQWINPVTFTLSSAIRQATKTIQTMTQHVQGTQSNDSTLSSPATIPIDLLQIATGIAFLTVAKVGMIVSGRIGTGILLAKLPSVNLPNEQLIQPQQERSKLQWSAPVAIGTVGLGWGAVVGGDVTHYMIVFTTPDAVVDFGRNHTVHLGTELGVSVGTIGAAASQNIQSKSSDYFHYHSTYAYAISSGLFFGVTLEGSMISIRNDVNAKFYGRPNINVLNLLQSPGVPAAEGLYNALDVAIRLKVPENAVFKMSRFLQKTDDIERDYR